MKKNNFQVWVTYSKLFFLLLIHSFLYLTRLSWHSLSILPLEQVFFFFFPRKPCLVPGSLPILMQFVCLFVCLFIFAWSWIFLPVNLTHPSNGLPTTTGIKALQSWLFLLYPLWPSRTNSILFLLLCSHHLFFFLQIILAILAHLLSLMTFRISLLSSH